MPKSVPNNWRWFTVKLIFEFQITGEPEKDKIDKNYTDRLTIYEESIILVKARSFEHAYKIADKKAQAREEEYVNPYGQNVIYKFTGAIDCFDLGGIDEFLSGDEIYSRYIRTGKGTRLQDFLDKFFPDIIYDEDAVDNSILMDVELEKELFKYIESKKAGK